MSEISELKINAERLGTVKEVKQFLTDLENAYNSLYVFDFLVEALSNDRDKKLKHLESDERFHYWRKKWKDFMNYKDFPYDPFIFELFMDNYLHRTDENSINLLEYLNKIDIDRIVLPADRLTITKINIQSPGKWNFEGVSKIIYELRQLIKDIWYENEHQRKSHKIERNHKEKMYEIERNHKEKMYEFELLEKKMKILEQLGYNPIEIRQIVVKMVWEPICKIVEHIDSGLIEGIVE